MVAITLFSSVSIAATASAFSSPTYTRVPSPDGHRPCGSAQVSIAATCSKFAVRREDRHSRIVWDLDPAPLLKALAVEHGDIVFAAHGHPDLLAVWRKERLMRRAADIAHILHRIRRGIDEADRVRSDRDHRKCAVIGRKPHAVHQQLA